jgi:hypothetical protein
MPDGTKDDDARLALALFRYRLIAEAVEARKGERAAILRPCAGEEHLCPDGRPMRVTLRTLQRWVARFEREKLAGLMRLPRKDKVGLEFIDDEGGQLGGEPFACRAVAPGWRATHPSGVQLHTPECGVSSHAAGLTTNPRVMPRPLAPEEALAAIDAWLRQPSVRTIEPTDRHWGLVKELLG